MPVRVKSKAKKAKTQKRDALPIAREKLRDSVNDLVHIRRHTIQIDTRLKRVKLLSRYDELTEAVEAHRGGHGGHWQGQLPFWADALVLLMEIDEAVAKMWPPPHAFIEDVSGKHAYASWEGWTVERLKALERKKWRPQDTAAVFKIGRDLEGFVKRIDTLFAPRPIPLPDPCPECDEKTVYRDGDGEQIRSSALQITDAGCTCGGCGANWPIEQLSMLGRLLEEMKRQREEACEE